MTRDRSEKELRQAYEGMAAQDLLSTQGWEWFSQRIRDKIDAINRGILAGGLTLEQYNEACTKRVALQAMLDLPQAAVDTYTKLLHKENDR